MGGGGGGGAIVRRVGAGRGQSKSVKLQTRAITEFMYTSYKKYIRMADLSIDRKISYSSEAALCYGHKGNKHRFPNDYCESPTELQTRWDWE